MSSLWSLHQGKQDRQRDHSFKGENNCKPHFAFCISPCDARLALLRPSAFTDKQVPLGVRFNKYVPPGKQYTPAALVQQLKKKGYEVII